MARSPADLAARAARLLPRPGRRCDGPRGQRAAGGGRDRAHLATGRDDPPRPAALHRPRAQAQRNGATTAAEPAFLTSREGRALALAPYNHRFTTISPPEIGAVTAIELGRRGRMLAAAEPTRRGGGSAMVVKER